ncbi:unnamed protein product [Moneuplotes crassus]|uniref:Uncharacterized protein n=1 Tax=Euplotes crassus TaxID=5936 RepID=A0AAD1XZE6_EUPCR|nr:unnamed protein product [Moneuplotes crassus]
MNMLESMLVLLRITHSTIMTLKSFQDQEELNPMKESIKIKQVIVKLLYTIFRWIKWICSKPEYLLDLSIITFWGSKLADLVF